MIVNKQYHKKHLTRNIELLSLLKGNPPSDYIEHYETTPFSEASEKDWVDFWETIEETPDKVREYELKEREYERQRAMLDAQNNKSKYYFDTDRNR